MDNESALSQICAILLQIRDLDPGLGVKLADQAIQHYVEFCKTARMHLACPVCFLTKGRISNLLPTHQFQTDMYRTNMKCEFCAASIPIMSMYAETMA